MTQLIGSAAPDLLCRFVATPHEAVFQFGRIMLSVGTNDPALLAHFGESIASSEADVHLKILRDSELDVCPSRPTVLDSESTLVVIFGRAAILALDRPRCEMFAFVGRGATDEWIRSVFMPTIHKFCPSAALPYRNSGSVRAKIHQHASSMPLATVHRSNCE